MKKYKILAALIGLVIVGKLVQKRIFIENYWWLSIIKNQSINIEGKEYTLKNFMVVNSWEYNLDNTLSKLNVLLEKDGIYFLYEALCNRTIKEELIENASKNFDTAIINNKLQKMTHEQANKWLYETDLGI